MNKITLQVNQNMIKFSIREYIITLKLLTNYFHKYYNQV